MCINFKSLLVSLFEGEKIHPILKHVFHSPANRSSIHFRILYMRLWKQAIFGKGGEWRKRLSTRLALADFPQSERSPHLWRITDSK